jgi:hypothetical protein
MKKRKLPMNHLPLLVAFLNEDLRAAASSRGWLYFYDAKVARKREKAMRLQADLQREVREILNLETRLAALDRLALKIERLGFANGRIADRYPTQANVDPAASVLNFPDGQKIIWQQVVGAGSLDLTLYRALDMALWSGEFAQVRVCRSCGKLFTSYRRGAMACSSRCNTEWHNEEDRRTGDSAKYYRDKVDAAKADALKYAKQNWSVNRIMTKTGLTRVALRKIGISDG